MPGGCRAWPSSAGGVAERGVAGDAVVLEVEGGTRRAAESAWAPAPREGAAAARRGTGRARRVSRGTAVATLVAAFALMCAKMLAVDQQPRAAAPSLGGRRVLLQALLRREALARRAARQELIFEPMRKIHSLAGVGGLANRTARTGVAPLRSPLIVDTSYKHFATPRLPPLPMSRDELFADARSAERALVRDENFVVDSVELEGRRVAEQMLVSQFKPRWLRGRSEAPLSAGVGKLYATNGTRPGRDSARAMSVLKSPPAEDGDPEIKEFMHNYRHGVQDVNSTAYKSIVQGDRIVTEPDDIVKIEEEVRRLRKERIASIEHEQAHKNRTHNLPGFFRWFQDEDQVQGVDETPNATYGTWVWCRNDTMFDQVHWTNGSIVGAPLMQAHQKFMSIKKCVSVSAPALEDEEEEDKEEEEAREKQKIEEDEIAELRKRNWDEPFMTYEPHPSAVGWDKAHWKTSDWLSWGFTGPVLSLLFTIFVVVTFGWLPGLGVALTCAVADTATYYWNW